MMQYWDGIKNHVGLPILLPLLGFALAAKNDKVGDMKIF